MALGITPDLELLSVVEGLVGGLAEQMGFPEPHRLGLVAGVGQACRLLMGTRVGNDGSEMHFEFAAFADRLEIVVEDGGKASQPTEADSYLLAQWLDRVSMEDTEEGRVRLTLVKSLPEVRS